MTIPPDELTRLYSGLVKLDPRLDEYKKRRDYITSEEYAVLHDLDSDPVNVATVCGWECEHCGALLIPTRYMPRPKGVRGLGIWLRPTSHGCLEEALHNEAHANAESIRKSNEAADRWTSQVKSAGLVGRLGDCLFSNFMPRDKWPQAMGLRADVEEYTKLLLAGELAEKNWLVLTGPVGTGKTHLAAAVINTVLGRGRSAYFRSWTQYLERIQATWNAGDNPERERESDILAELNKGWLVVIDDLDKRRSTEWVKGMLYSFLNTRYTNNLPTIITLNTPLSAPDPKAPGRLALHDIMGGAVLDRVIQSMWKYLEFNGPSYRSNLKINN